MDSKFGWPKRHKCLAFLAFLATVCLAGCASTAPPPPPAGDLLHDSAFQPTPALLTSAEAVFALSPAMKAYLSSAVEPALRREGPGRGLFSALYSKQQLQLEYDAERTRTAAEAFAGRAGNCLSLAIMTGAFARELGLSVRYQVVDVASTWQRSGDLVLHNSHVNVSIKGGISFVKAAYGGGEWLTIDFIPVPEFFRADTRVVSETRMVAMYMNNRAAEELSVGRLDAAYGWARAAVLHDTAYADAYNTLAVIYRRHGQPDWAEAALQRTLALDADNLNAIANFAGQLRSQGRESEAATLFARLKRLQPDTPFQNFERGMQALRNGDYALARDLLEKEVSRTNDYHEVHLGLAIAYLKLGDPRSAARHLEQARENSTNRQQRALYASKLEHLKTMIH